MDVAPSVPEPEAIGGGSDVRIAEDTTAGLEPVKARRPVVISYNTAPRAKMSLRWSVERPWSCSGDMYGNVPNERLSLEVLHDQVRARGLTRNVRRHGAKVVQRGVAERRDDTRFAFEALAAIGVGRKRFGPHLDRNRAVQARVARLVPHGFRGPA